MSVSIFSWQHCSLSLIFKCHVKTWENTVLYRSFRFDNERERFGKRLPFTVLRMLKRERCVIKTNRTYLVQEVNKIIVDFADESVMFL